MTQWEQSIYLTAITREIDQEKAEELLYSSLTEAEQDQLTREEGRKHESRN